MSLKLVFVLLCLGIIDCAAPAFQNHTSLRTGQSDFFQSLGIISTTPAISFPVIYQPALPGATLYGCVGLIGYESPIANDFDFNLTSFNKTSTGLIVSLLVYGNTRLNMISINYLVIGANLTYIEAIYDCFNCTQLASGMGYRSQSRNTTTQTNLNQVKYSVGFVSAIRIRNDYQKQVFLRMETNKLLSSKIITTSFSTDGNTTVTSICYYVLSCYKEVTSYLDIISYGYRELSNLTSGRFANQPDKMDMFKVSNSMFFAIAGFRLRNDYIRTFYLNTTANYSNLDINYTSNYGTEDITVAFLFLVTRASCSPLLYDAIANDCISNATCLSQGMNISNTTDTCLLCHYSCKSCSSAGGLYNNCLDCDKSMFRVLNGSQCPCISTTIDYYKVSQCSTCDSLFTRCSLCSIANTTLICSNCGSYQANTISGVIVSCDCAVGYTDINGVCTNTTGCINYTFISSSTIGRCNQCNQSGNYKLNVTSSYLCECSVGFVSSNSSCVSVCGDGKLVSGEYCDDGNTVNGDGCSSTCVIETGWRCYSTSLSQSVCYLSTVQLSIGYLRRVNTANRMIMGLVMNPLNFNYSTTALKSTISHDIPSSDFSVQYSDGLIVLSFDYNQTLEGKNYMLNITFNPLLPSEVSSVSFKAVGMNAMLSYDSYYSHSIILSILLILVDCLGIVLLLLSVFSERLIGIEIIQTIQSVFFLLAFLPATPNALSPLQNLKYSNGYNYLSTNYYIIYKQKFNISSLGFQTEFLANFNIMFLILICTTFTIIILKFVTYFQTQDPIPQQTPIEQQIQQNNTFKQITISEITDKAISNIYLIITFLCFFSIIFAVANYLTESPTPLFYTYSTQLNLIASYISLFILFFLICFIILNHINGLQMLKFKHINPNYPIMYVFQQLLFILSATFLNSNKIAIISVLVLSIGSITMICIVKPYPNAYHNRVLIFNKVIIILSVGLYLVNNMMPEMMLWIGCYLLTICLYLVVLLNGLRLWKWRNYNLLEGNEILEEKQYTKQHLKGLNSKKATIQRQLDNMSMESNNQVKDFQWFQKQEQLDIKKKSEQLINRYKKTISQEDEELKMLKKRLKKEYKQKIPKQ